MKKFLCAFMAAALITANIPAAWAASRFPDMGGHWSEAYVEYLVDRGAVGGAGGCFRPQDSMSLAQFVKVIVAAAAGSKVQPENAHWAREYMDAALESGLIDRTDYASGWDEPISRLTMARIAHMAMLGPLAEDDAADVSSAGRLEDIDACHECRVHVEQCYAKGIIGGRPGNLFDGESLMTRAEGCAVLARLLNRGMRVLPAPDARPAPEGYKLIAPDEALELLNGYGAVLLDVRTAEEHAAKYIPGSVCVPLETLEDAAESALPDRDAPIVVYCAAGSRSKRACELLIKLGYTGVYDIGGIDKWPYAVTSGT